MHQEFDVEKYVEDERAAGKSDEEIATALDEKVSEKEAKISELEAKAQELRGGASGGQTRGTVR
jgi:hypothetical protein